MTCRLLVHRLGSSALVTASIWGIIKACTVNPAKLGAALWTGIGIAVAFGFAIGGLWWFAMWIIED